MPERTAIRMPPLASRVVSRAASASLRELLLSVAAVSIFVRLPWIVGPGHGTRLSDSGVYLGMASDLLGGRGFYTGTELRTPGYAVLLAGLSLLPGPTAQTAVVAQHLLGAALTVSLVWGTWRFFGRGAAFWAAAIAALSPVLVSLEGDVLPDFLLACLVVCGAFLLAIALETGSPRLRLVAAAGVMFGTAALVKPAGQILIATALVPLLASPRQVRAGLRAGALLAACFALTVAPWLARNAIQYGDVRLSVQDGPALWLRLFDWDRRPIPTTTREGRIAKRLYDETAARTPNAHPTNTYEFVLEELYKQYGYSEQAATSLQRRLAIAAIREAPRVYLQGTWEIGRTLLWFTHELYSARDAIEAQSASAPQRVPTGPAYALFSLGGAAIWWLWTMSLALLSAFLLPFTKSQARRACALSLGGTWLLVTTATAATTFPDPRYAAPVAPLLWVLGAAGASLILEALVRTFSRAEAGNPDRAGESP